MMRNKLINHKFILLILAMVALVSCEKDKVTLQTYGTITGTVLDANTNGPVIAANISTNPPSSAVLTDQEGKFLITDVPAGNVVISVKKENYNSSSTSVLVQQDRTTNVTILLEVTEPSAGSGVVLSDPSPANQAIDMPRSVDLQWKMDNSSTYDSIKFDVMLYESDNLVGKLVASDIRDTTYTVEDLDFQKTYYWQIIAKYGTIELNRSTVWSFSTILLPELPYFYAREINGSYEIINSDSVINDTTAPLVQLTNDPAHTNWLPLLNPQKTLVSFISNKLVNPYIYTVRRDGSDEARVWGFPVIGYHNQGEGYCWSPSGQFVLYGYYNILKKTDIYSYNSFDVAYAPAERHFRQCDWNGHTQKIVVQTVGKSIYNAEIYMMNEDGSNMTLLVDNEPGRTDSPSLSIDGQTLLFSHDAMGFDDPGGRQLDACIYLMDVNEPGSMLNISINKPDGTNDLQPRYTPNGAFVIFMNEDNTGTGRKDIYVMDLTGGNRVKLIEDAIMPFMN